MKKYIYLLFFMVATYSPIQTKLFAPSKKVAGLCTAGIACAAAAYYTYKQDIAANPALKDPKALGRLKYFLATPSGHATSWKNAFAQGLAIFFFGNAISWYYKEHQAANVVYAAQQALQVPEDKRTQKDNKAIQAYNDLVMRAYFAKLLNS